MDCRTSSSVDLRKPGRSAELSAAQRAYICGLYDGLKNAAEVARRTGIPKSTIKYTIKLSETRQEQQSGTRSGRPKALSALDGQRLVRHFQQHPRDSFDQVIQTLELNISRTTCRRYLKAEGFVRTATGALQPARQDKIISRKRKSSEKVSSSS